MDNKAQSEEKLEQIERFFVQYGAVPAGLKAAEAISGERRIFEREGVYYRAGTAVFDGKQFYLLSSIDNPKYAEIGILEDIDVLPSDAPASAIEKAVRCAFGIEPYPEE